MMHGYILDMVQILHPLCSVPITILGGASCYRDLSELFKIAPGISAAAGSLFVFKGDYRAVLISYPDLQEKEKIFTDAGLN